MRRYIEDLGRRSQEKTSVVRYVGLVTEGRKGNSTVRNRFQTTALKA
jgi:hypothetical protein